jgi:hypothetical protein
MEHDGQDGNTTGTTARDVTVVLHPVAFERAWNTTGTMGTRRARRGAM